MKSFTFLAVLFALAVSQIAAAGLPVIHDAGGTRPLAPLYADLLPERAPATSLETRRIPDPAVSLRAPDQATALRQYDERRFPVRTPVLSPGNVASRPLPASLQQMPPPIPFFIVGTDSLSTHWLTTWRSRLRELGASGLVVEAQNRAAFDNLVQVSGGLPLASAPGGAIARVLGLAHYPVLISREGIEQ